MLLNVLNDSCWDEVLDRHFSTQEEPNLGTTHIVLNAVEEVNT